MFHCQLSDISFFFSMLIEWYSPFICIVYSMTIVASQLMYVHNYAAFVVGYMLHYKIFFLSNYYGIVFPTYVQGAASIGSVSNAPLSGRVHSSAESVPSSHVPLIIPSAAPTHQLPPSVASSAPPLPIHDTNAHTSRSTNLVTPDFFAPPPSSSTPLAPPGASVIPTAPPLHPTPVSVQRSQYGAPLLQPFPPPTPPPSLNPVHSDRPVVTRDRVKDALQRLVQVSSTLKTYRVKLFGLVLFIFANSHQMPNRATSSSIWCTGNCRNHLYRLLSLSGVSGS